MKQSQNHCDFTGVWYGEYDTEFVSRPCIKCMYHAIISRISDKYDNSWYTYACIIRRNDTQRTNRCICVAWVLLFSPLFYWHNLYYLLPKMSNARSHLGAVSLAHGFLMFYRFCLLYLLLHIYEIRTICSFDKEWILPHKCCATISILEIVW